MRAVAFFLLACIGLVAGPAMSDQGVELSRITAFQSAPVAASNVVMAAPPTITDPRRSVSTFIFQVQCRAPGVAVVTLSGAPAGTQVGTNQGNRITCTSAVINVSVVLRWNTAALPGVHTFEVVFRDRTSQDLVAVTVVSVGS